MTSLTKIYFKSFCENFKYKNESSVNIYSTNKTKCCNGNSFAEKSKDAVESDNGDIVNNSKQASKLINVYLILAQGQGGQFLHIATAARQHVYSSLQPPLFSTQQIIMKYQSVLKIKI